MVEVGKLEIVRKEMEELAEKQSWIRQGIAKILREFEDKVLPEDLERFRFRYKVGTIESAARDIYYYFYINEEGIYIEVKYDYEMHEDATYIWITDKEKLKSIPVWVLRNVAKDFPQILNELINALKEANKNYGEAVKKLKKLEGALVSL